MENENFSGANTSTSTTTSTSLIDYSGCLIKPHDVVSRDVKEEDLGRVMIDAHLMYQICFARCGRYNGAIAVAHSQITNEDPLRFFVTYDKKVIINPVIINHTKTTVDSEEGCITFMFEPPKIVQRYNKITVEYQTLNPDGTLSDVITEGFSGKESKMYQHELEHLDGKYIYN